MKRRGRKGQGRTDFSFAGIIRVCSTHARVVSLVPYECKPRKGAKAIHGCSVSSHPSRLRTTPLSNYNCVTGFLLALALAVFHNSPVLDIKLIREKPDFVRQRLATRGAGDEALIDEILQARRAAAQSCWRKSKRSRPSATASRRKSARLMGQKKLAEAEAKKKETARSGRPDRGAGQAGGGGGGGARSVDAAPAESAARIGAVGQKRGG